MIPRALYRLADALELTLELDGEQVRGKRNRRLELAGVPVQVPLEVMASRLFGTDAALVLQSTGELGLTDPFQPPDRDLFTFLARQMPVLTPRHPPTLQAFSAL